MYFRLTSDRRIASDRCIRCYTHWKLVFVCVRYVVCMNVSLSLSYFLSFPFFLIHIPILVRSHFCVYSMNIFYSSDRNQHHRSCDHIFKCFAESLWHISYFYSIWLTQSMPRKKSKIIQQYKYEVGFSFSVLYWIQVQHLSDSSSYTEPDVCVSDRPVLITKNQVRALIESFNIVIWAPFDFRLSFIITVEFYFMDLASTNPNILIQCHFGKELVDEFGTANAIYQNVLIFSQFNTHW